MNKKKLYLTFLIIFSLPVFSAPNSFSIACEQVIYKSWDSKSNNKDSYRYRYTPPNYVFVYINDPSDPKEPYIYNFGKIPKKPLKDTIWLNSSFDFEQSTDTEHKFRYGYGLTQGRLTINRETLEITTLENDYIERGADIVRVQYQGIFSRCELIDAQQADRLRELSQADYQNFQKELEEEEQQRKAELESKQKI